MNDNEQKNEQRKETEIIIVLDRSGSMGSIAQATGANIGNYRGAKSKMASSLSKADFDSLLSKQSEENLGFSDDQRKKSI